MIAPAAQQTLVPSTAGFHIAYGDQGLRTHAVSVSNPGRTDRCLAGAPAMRACGGSFTCEYDAERGGTIHYQSADL